jgi:hypothetical protein
LINKKEEICRENFIHMDPKFEIPEKKAEAKIKTPEMKFF